MNLVKDAALNLGKNSLLNIPMAPVNAFGAGASCVAEGMGLAAGEAASLHNQLTFDNEDVARHRQVRSEKRIDVFSDCFDRSVSIIEDAMHAATPRFGQRASTGPHGRPRRAGHRERPPRRRRHTRAHRAELEL